MTLGTTTAERAILLPAPAVVGDTSILAMDRVGLLGEIPAIPDT